MGYWLIFLAGDAALGCYVASLWVRGHAALQGAAPHGLGGRGFLAYLAVVVALVAMTLWTLLEGGSLRRKAGLVLVDLAAVLAGLHLLSDQQQQFAEWAAVLALYNTAHLYPALAFHVLGPLLEGRGSGRSLVER